MDLDEVDRAILASLLSDARASQRQLSREVGVAQGTITNRIRRMEETGDNSRLQRGNRPRKCRMEHDNYGWIDDCQRQND